MKVNITTDESSRPAYLDGWKSEKEPLKKPGADKLGLTFRLAPEYQVETNDLPNGHREHRITCTLRHINSGRQWGQGVGSCTSMESKYRFRMEDTGRPVPAKYWD